jgi:hypothetical protein
MRNAALILFMLLAWVSSAWSDSNPQDITEVKISIAPRQLTRVKKALNITTAPVPQVIYYLDTKNQDLFKQGVVIRVRRTGEKKYLVVVKLRPVEQKHLPNYAEFKEAVFDYDLTPKGKTISGALKNKITPAFFDDILKSRQKGSTLLTEQQKNFMRARLGTTSGKPLEVDILGPIQSQVWNSGSWKIEQWTLPNGKKLDEVSKKVPSRQEKQAVREITKILETNQISKGDIDFKTRAALESLSRAKCIARSLKLQ